MTLSLFLVTQLGRRKKVNNGGGWASALDPSDNTWNRKLATVVKKVLVIRIQAADRATTASESQLADDIFGAAHRSID